jgi:hypothetical protein
MRKFDHEKMLAFALSAIRKFADEHAAETFYGFSIDASLLCLNSEEALRNRSPPTRPGGPSGTRMRKWYASSNSIPGLGIPGVRRSARLRLV